MNIKNLSILLALTVPVMAMENSEEDNQPKTSQYVVQPGEEEILNKLNSQQSQDYLNEAMMTAGVNGHQAVVEKCLDLYSDLKYTHDKYVIYDILCAAIFNGHEGVNERFLMRPEIVEALDRFCTGVVLNEAVSNGCGDTVKYLFNLQKDKRLDQNLINDALWHATNVIYGPEKKSLKNIAYLLNQPEGRSPDQETIIKCYNGVVEDIKNKKYAEFEVKNEIAKVLLEKSQQKTSQYVMQPGEKEILSKLNISHSQDDLDRVMVTTGGNGHQAVAEQCLKLYKQFDHQLDKSSCIMKDTLYGAIINGHESFILWLLNQPECDNALAQNCRRDVFVGTAEYGHKGAVECLLNQNIDQNGINSALWNAARKNHQAVVELLLNQPEGRSPDQETITKLYHEMVGEHKTEMADLIAQYLPKN